MDLKEIKKAFLDLLDRYEKDYTDSGCPPDLEDIMTTLLDDYQHYENFRHLVRSVGLKKVKKWTKEVEKECEEDIALNKCLNWQRKLPFFLYNL